MSDARIVDENVEAAAEAVLRMVEHVPRAFGQAEVGGARRRLPACRADLVCGIARPVAVDIGEQHMRAFRGEAAPDLAADAASAARDDGGLAL